MLSDIEIAQKAKLHHIKEIAAQLNVAEDQLEQYGKHKAKLPLSLIDDEKAAKSNLILVTAITPTPAGEGKTTTSIGLADGLAAIGKKVAVVLREPSLGPVFGIKGGAAGGGYSQVVPMEDINLHFTGDFSAIEKANNLLAALIDNNIQSKTRSLGIDPRTVLWKRCMDMNDRSLRKIVSALGGKSGGIPMETGFNITAASEIMAILCLSNNLEDLKDRLGNIYVGDTFSGKAVYARDLKAQGAMAALLKDAIKPNLVQTLENVPAFIHGGPFANIAQGTNSVIATKMGMSLADYVVTEAGFGADLGAEKFFNIKCRNAGISPRAVVLVATIRALKYHGGKALSELKEPDAEAVKAGSENLRKHLETIASFKVPAVVCVNRFQADTDEEVEALKSVCQEYGVEVAVSDGFVKGGEGTKGLARAVIGALGRSGEGFRPTYDLKDPVREKIEKVCKTVYGAKYVILSNKAKSQLRRFEELGFGELPICIAKTQKSLSDDEKLLGRPVNFDIHIREFEIAAGAGFLIPIAGNILRMPGLPGIPSAEGMDIDANGNISGLS
ncbi:formate--tetrahydrofolate ligase [Robertkochia marina]|uniref:Formate--tetrahydrofolate ligase n=1 Tax=Robertkochia marina TaxID=1227945 RepID=A0A4V3UYE7_9FLAO|nr:formate--tetrahydrofolate ligase [Robertkochia marina]THD69368.1 formate--tetrahydrofolate ligase [Robertkochia marina]TRZ47372.1 formate--tetrahydrofolate ligase [Robertkochia marina]